MIEKEFWQDKGVIVGCDEVGRGPLAGPVVGAAVSSGQEIRYLATLEVLGVTDSKKLTSKKRQTILKTLGISITNISFMEKNEIITDDGLHLSFCVVKKDPAYIDQVNILQASLKCMEEACLQVGGERAIILIDGNKTFTSYPHFEQHAIVKGDSKSILIGLASIIAKEVRDSLMQRYAQKYPQYGFEKHAGYPTSQHRAAIAKYGPTPIHRKSFKGVKEFLL